MNLSKIGQFISRRRMAMGLTQAQLAERLNVTDKAVSKWERGKSLPDVTLFSRVAAELRVSVVELLSGELMNVVRSSNLDEAVDWDGKAAQATPSHLTPGRSCGFTGFALLVRLQSGAHSLLYLYRPIRPDGSQSKVRREAHGLRGLRHRMVSLGGTWRVCLG